MKALAYSPSSKVGNQTNTLCFLGSRYKKKKSSIRIFPSFCSPVSPLFFIPKKPLRDAHKRQVIVSFYNAAKKCLENTRRVKYRMTSYNRALYKMCIFRGAVTMGANAIEFFHVWLLWGRKEKDGVGFWWNVKESMHKKFNNHERGTIKFSGISRTWKSKLSFE